MKNSILLTLAASAVLLLSAGCRHTEPKVTILPDPAVNGRASVATPRGPEDAARIPGAEAAVPQAVAGGAAVNAAT